MIGGSLAREDFGRGLVAAVETVEDVLEKGRGLRIPLAGIRRGAGEAVGCSMYSVEPRRGGGSVGAGVLCSLAKSVDARRGKRGAVTGVELLMASVCGASVLTPGETKHN